MTKLFTQSLPAKILEKNKLGRKRTRAETPIVIKPVSKGYLVWGVLILILLFSGLIRYRFLAVPLERDEGEYAYAGQLILQGIPPYQNVYNMKFPGIYAAYAVLLAVFGQTHQGIHLGLLVINEITIVLVFLLTKRLFNASAALVSAAIFAILSISQLVFGFSANAEHFVILFAVAGLLVMLWALKKNSFWGLFPAGILLGISITMKQHGLAFSIMAVFYLVLEMLVQKPILWRKFITRGLYLTAGIAAVVAFTCMLMIWAGVFKSFQFWVVDYARTYISQLPWTVGVHNLRLTFSDTMSSAPLIWILAGFGLICLMTKQLTGYQKRFLFLYAMFSFLSICPGFYFRPHYFVLLLPCTAILTATTVYVLPKWLLHKAVFYQYIPFLLVIVSMAQTFYLQREYLFRMTPDEVCWAAYGMNPFIESIEVASYIRKRSDPHDTIVVLGSEPQIFFYSQRRSASGHIYMYPLMEKHKFAVQMQKDFIREAEAGNPKYFVYIQTDYSWLQEPTSPRLIFEWAKQYCSKHFRLVGTAEIYGDTTVYRWDSQVRWPLTSNDYVAVFERKTDQ